MKTLLDKFLNGIERRLEKKGYSYKKRVDIVDRLRDKWQDNIIFVDPVDLAKAMLVSVDDDDIVNFDNETGLVIQEGNLLPADHIAFATILRKKELFAREESIQLWTEYYENSEELKNDPWPDIEVDAINERGSYGRTPVHQAVESDDYDTVCHLIDNGADLNIADNNGHTLSQFALVLGGRDDIYAYLVEIERRQK